MRSGGTRRLAVAAALGAAAAAGVGAGDCARLPRVLGPVAVPDTYRAGSPTRWYRAARFSPACRNLNRCYATLDRRPAGCDRRLEIDMMAACRRAYDQANEAAALARCRLLVTRLHGRVVAARDDGFRDAQYEARWLEDAGRRRVPYPKRKWRTEERPGPRPWDPPREADYPPAP